MEGAHLQNSSKKDFLSTKSGNCSHTPWECFTCCWPYILPIHPFQCLPIGPVYFPSKGEACPKGEIMGVGTILQDTTGPNVRVALGFCRQRAARLSVVGCSLCASVGRGPKPSFLMCVTCPFFITISVNNILGFRLHTHVSITNWTLGLIQMPV